MQMKSLAYNRDKGLIHFLICQVRTRLANPTKYHMVQTQRRQVKEYLAESEEDLSDQSGNRVPQTPDTRNPNPSAGAGEGGSGAYLRPPSTGHLQSHSAPGVVPAQVSSGQDGPLSPGEEAFAGGNVSPMPGPASAPPAVVPGPSNRDNGIGDGQRAAAQDEATPQPSTSSGGAVEGGARRKNRKRSDQVGQ